jgi:hypothetical protein
MGKNMDKRKRLIRGAAVFVVWAAIVVAVRVLQKREDHVFPMGQCMKEIG